MRGQDGVKNDTLKRQMCLSYRMIVVAIRPGPRDVETYG